MTKINYVYCDSCVFLAYFNAEPERVKILDQLFEEITADSQRKIITSTLSIVEVSHTRHEGDTSRLQTGLAESLNTFWGNDRLLEFIEFHQPLAYKTRNLIRETIEKGYRLKPADAVHLLSAEHIGVSEFFTYDDKILKKYETFLNFKIVQPYVNQPRLI